MTHPFLRTLLRRTAAIGVTVAPFLLSAPASALQVILNNATGNSCTYTGMTVDPAGNVTVTCQGSTTTTGPGTFSVSAATTMAAPASGTALWNTTVLRTGGTSGSATVDFVASGSACTTAVATATTLSFADGGTQSTQSLSVPVTITGVGTCTITLSNATTAALGVSTQTVNVTTSTGGTGSNGVPIVAGCSPDPSTTMGTLPAFNGTPLYPLKHSGEVTSYPLPRLPAGKNVQWIAFGETPIAYTPSPYQADVSFSTCPGVFSPKVNAYDYCNWTGITQKNGFTVKWAETSTYSRFYGACLADPSTQYYFNVRWSYTSCSQGAAACGFSVSSGG